ncbi:MAG: PEGA domain-containing protein [Lentimicrobium sp.]|jgi:hypothetical protein|nr:PEGA domain-containing protein [Lentimicrobium sp.]
MKKNISLIIFAIIVSSSLFAQKLEFTEKPSKASDYAKLVQPEKVLLIFETDLNLHFKSSMENLIEPIKVGKTYQLFITQTKCIITISDQDENKTDISFGNMGANFPPLNRGQVKFFEIHLTYPLKYIEQTEQKKKEGKVDNQMLYEKEALIIFTVDPPDLKLQFSSTEKITDSKNEPGVYKLFLKPTSQNITIKYPGLDDTHIFFENLAVKEVRYFYVILPNKFRNIQTETTDKNISVGSYRIETDPPGAFIEMYGNPAFNSQKNKTPFTIEGYETGSKILTIRLPEYELVIDTIQIGNRKANNSKYKLIPEFAFVNLEISPGPPYSKLFINDIEKINYKNGEEYKVGKGDVSVVVKADHYYPASKIINTIAGKVHNVSIELKPIMGSITILPGENADGAEVYIEGSKIGNLPINNYTIQEGDYSIILKKKGYETEGKSYLASIKENKNTTLSKVNMVNMKNIEIVTIPDDNATIYIDDNLVGKSNLSCKVAIGKHRIRITRDHYQTLTTELNVEEGENNSRFSFTLIPILYSVSLNSNPKSSSVAIDGVSMGVTPTTFTSKYGSYKVTLSKENYFDKSYYVSVPSKENKKFKSLIPEQIININFVYGLNSWGFEIGAVHKHFTWSVEAYPKIKNDLYSSNVIISDLTFNFEEQYLDYTTQKYSIPDSTGVGLALKAGFVILRPFMMRIYAGYGSRFGFCYNEVYKAKTNLTYNNGNITINENDLVRGSTKREEFNSVIFGISIPIGKALTIKSDYWLNSERGGGFVFGLGLNIWGY